MEMLEGIFRLRMRIKFPFVLELQNFENLIISIFHGILKIWNFGILE